MKGMTRQIFAGHLRRLPAGARALICASLAVAVLALALQSPNLEACRDCLVCLAHLAARGPYQQATSAAKGSFAGVLPATLGTPSPYCSSHAGDSCACAGHVWRRHAGEHPAKTLTEHAISALGYQQRAAFCTSADESERRVGKLGLLAMVTAVVGAAWALRRRSMPPPTAIWQRWRRRSSPRAVFCTAHGHSHDHDDHDHEKGHARKEHDHDRDHENECGTCNDHGEKANAHAHDREHGHDSGHERAHQAEHGHDEHDDHHSHAHSHGHSDGCVSGCGHSHGEVPAWIPGSSLIKRALQPLRRNSVMCTAAAIYFLSILPRVPASLVAAGPAAVFFVFGLPEALSLLAQMRAAAAFVDVHFLMTAAAFAAVGIGHAQEGALLLLLFEFSHKVEEKLSAAAQSSLDALSRMSPETARRLPAGSAASLSAAEGAVEVAASELVAGDRILVKAGEVVPVDGDVMDGTSQVSLDHLTGEPLPQTVTVGDAVISGAVTIDGALLLNVLRPAHESTIQRISRLTATAKASRPQLVTLIDAVASKWSLAVVASTAMLVVLPPLLFGEAPATALYRALVWLVTASPCALVLATPLVYVSALSVAASNGILLKGARPLDALATARGFAFDKTGTITTGLPVLERVTAVGQQGAASEDKRALQISAALGRLSVHPISRALAAAAGPSSGFAAPEVRDHKTEAGSGVSAELVYNHTQEESVSHAALGRPEYVAQHLEAVGGAHGKDLAASVRAAVADAHANGSNDASGSALAALGVVAEGSSAPEAWLFELRDHVKSSAQALTRIGRQGPVYMLTGDVRANAERVANSLGASATFAGVYADLRPEEKLLKVKELNAAFRAKDDKDTSLRAQMFRALGASAGGVVMVGDGINDAPALAAASVGISLTTQADGAVTGNAVDGADVLVLRRAGDPAGEDDINRIEWLLKLSRKADGIVKQNLFMALFSIAGASATTLFAGLPLWAGVLLHEGATVLVAVNSLSLLSEARRKK